MSPDTRSRLIYTAMQLFLEKGYGPTSVAEVLQTAKVNAGSLYHFFPGKQDLLLAVLDAYHGGIRQMLLEPAWKGIDRPIERVFALLARYRQALLQTDCFYACPIGSLALELHEPDPPVREKLAANFQAWTAAVRECLEDPRSELPPKVNRQELAEFVLTTMQGAVMQARTFRDIAYFDSAVNQLRRYFDLLLKPDKKRASPAAPVRPRKKRRKT